MALAAAIIAYLFMAGLVGAIYDGTVSGACDEVVPIAMFWPLSVPIICGVYVAKRIIGKQ